MTSKTTRLLAQLDDTEARQLIGPLGELPSADVDRIVQALRAARKAGRADEAAARAQRRADRQANRKDDDKIVYAAESMLKSLARRAAYTLETLADLNRFIESSGAAMLALAVDGARAQGYSDAEIARALSVTSEAIGQRFGRRHGGTPAISTQDVRRATVLRHYGETCACCDGTDHLAIDHINGDGKEHRQEIDGHRGGLYAWLIEQDFPSGYQTLCRPCNSSKGRGERCTLSHAKSGQVPA